MNATKASVSVMFAAAGDGTILPPYVVHKAQHMYESWRAGGPLNSRFNRTKSQVGSIRTRLGRDHSNTTFIKTSRSEGLVR